MSKHYTFEELLNEKIHMVTEDEEHYYVKLDTTFSYDDSLWVVDKNTKNVSYMSSIEYTFGGTHERTKPVNPEILKRTFV